MPKIYYNKKVPADENTLALLHFDDPNDVAKDEIGNTWTVSGSPTISSDWSGAFGGKSLYLNGSSYLKTDGKLLPQTFTVDLRIKTGSSVSGFQMLAGQLQHGTAVDWHFSIYNNKFFVDSAFGRFYSQTSPQANTVYHLAVSVDSSNTFRMFVNGVLETSGTVSTTRVNRYYLTIGAAQNPTAYFTGYIDEFRISNCARWTANFTPPTEPYELGEKIGTRSIELSEVN